MKRGMYWANRWGVYQEIKRDIEAQKKPTPAADPDGEPEWMILERTMKERANGSSHQD